MKVRFSIVHFLLLIWGLLGLQTFAYSIENELKLKTAYLYKFTKFIHWPEDTQDIIICAPSHHLIAKPLKALEVKKSNTVTIKVKLYDNLNDIMDCNIIYLADITDSLFMEITQYTQGQPIVTISNREEFSGNNTVLEFYIIQFYGSESKGRLRFSIDLENAKESNISFSSSLIKFSKMK